MLMEQSRDVRLVSYPEGLPTDKNFGMGTVRMQAPPMGEVQVRNTWMSVDPRDQRRLEFLAGDNYFSLFENG